MDGSQDCARKADSNCHFPGETAGLPTWKFPRPGVAPAGFSIKATQPRSTFLRAQRGILNWNRGDCRKLFGESTVSSVMSQRINTSHQLLTLPVSFHLSQFALFLNRHLPTDEGSYGFKMARVAILKNLVNRSREFNKNKKA
jgi:hypothetical protein